jgi:hypothetical protein
MAEPTGIKRVWGYLGEMGWPHDLVTDSVIRTQYEGHFGQVKVMLHVHELGLRMAINPVLSRPSDGQDWGKSVANLVVALNEESQMIQVGLDREGDVYVKVDLPLVQLEYEQFVYVIFSLCQVSEQLMVPVLQAHAYDTHELLDNLKMAV